MDSDDESDANSFVPRKRLCFDLSANKASVSQSGNTKNVQTEASFNFTFPNGARHVARTDNAKQDETMDESTLSTCFSRLSSRENTNESMCSDATSDPNDEYCLTQFDYDKI